MLRSPSRLAPSSSPFLLELATGQAEYVLDGLAFDQCADHGTGRHPVDVTDHPAKLDATIVQYLVQPVGLGRQHRAEFALSLCS